MVDHIADPEVKTDFAARELAPGRAALSLADRFTRAASAYPDRQAVVHGARRVTFAQLSRQARSIAAVLRSRGIGPESLVGLYLPRGIEQVASILGVLMAEGAYVPLDPELPAKRVAYMLENSGASVVLSHSGLAGRFPAGEVPVLYADELRVPATVEALPVQRSPDDLCYVVYTSGSTGEPKGVQITQGNVAVLADAMETCLLSGTEGCRVGWNASASFDASVQQWIRLCRGDTLVVLSEQVRRDPEAIVRLIATEQLTDLDITPTHLASLIDSLETGITGPQAEPLRLLVGGEPISPGLWKRLTALDKKRIARSFNLYGPSECTVNATMVPVTGDVPVIGDSLPGVRVHLLDPLLRPVPDGQPGELFIAGSGVSRGYRGAAALTARSFLPDPFQMDGSRMYRTGDLARRRDDGLLEYLGRRDLQVKIRGFRVELGEVEAALARIPGVVQAVVILRDDLPGGDGLAAYCQLSTAITPEQVGAAVRAWLPDYMVPSVIAQVDTFPRSTSGKADRTALREIGLPGTHAGPGEEPADGTEKLVATVWAQLLGIDKVGAFDNFFLLGGNSLLAYRLAARLRRLSGRSLPLLAVFEKPVLRELAAAVDGADPMGPELNR